MDTGKKPVRGMRIPLEEMERAVQARRAALAEEAQRQKQTSSPDNSAAAEPWVNPFDAFDTSWHPDATKAHAITRQWVYNVSAGLEPRGLILWANAHKGRTGYGSGKTLLATMAFEVLKVMLNARQDRQRATMIGAADFFQRIKDAYATDEPVGPIFREWARGHFILDDWGKQYTTVTGAEWAREQTYKLINTLYESGNGLLITSNEDPATINNMVGGASFSRLLGLCGPGGMVDLSAVPDYRLKKGGFHG